MTIYLVKPNQSNAGKGFIREEGCNEGYVQQFQTLMGSKYS